MSPHHRIHGPGKWAKRKRHRRVFIRFVSQMWLKKNSAPRNAGKQNQPIQQINQDRPRRKSSRLDNPILKVLGILAKRC